MRAPVLATSAWIVGILAGTATLSAEQTTSVRMGTNKGSLLHLAQASPGVERAPVAPIPGQLTLTEEQRKQIRQSVEQAGPHPQPVPRAFAPAVGMTSPPELKLEPLPEPARKAANIGDNHRYVLLNNGMLMLVGDNRLVVAMIGPDR